MLEDAIAVEVKNQQMINTIENDVIKKLNSTTTNYHKNYFLYYYSEEYCLDLH